MSIESSRIVSRTLSAIPPMATDRVYISPERREDAVAWLEKNRESIVSKTSFSRE
jgi:hypothetical protein